MKDFFKAVTGFIGHYAAEAALVGSALRATLTALPVDAHEREKILVTIETLEALPEKLAKAVKQIADNSGVKVTVKKADVESAVAAELPSALSAILPDMLEKLIAEKLDTLTAPDGGGQGEAGAVA